MRNIFSSLFKKSTIQKLLLFEQLQFACSNVIEHFNSSNVSNLNYML
jgi:hypothetical protein